MVSTQFGKWVSYIRIALLSSILCVTSYLLHKRIQKEYYMRCSSDVVQIIFFRNSDFCQLLKSMSTLIEDRFIGVFQTFLDLTFTK
jgi:hypothetical protein